MSAELPHLLTPIPGPASRAWVDRLARVECPAITARRQRRAQALGQDQDDPIVWARARGTIVEDVDGNRFVDLTAGFGVASAGHAAGPVREALHAQGERLLHAMGDAFPDPRRIELMERLCALAGLDRVLFGSSGSDAVEAALKTARLRSGRSGVLVFDRGYHGLSYGALPTSDYRAADFRGPFADQLGAHVHLARFGGPLPRAAELRAQEIGAVLVEPIQGRGGMRPAADAWLRELRALCDEAGAVLIFDEIQSGLWRTGPAFAFQAAGVRPDLVCTGKALAGGFPLSACLGTEATMAAWGHSRGEAIHTQTFLGNPLGCAMALRALDHLEALAPGVPERHALFAEGARARGLPLRGRGLMLGLGLPDGPDALATSRALLREGYIVLPAGEARPGEDPREQVVLGLTPPLGISPAQIEGFFRALDRVRA